MGFDISFFLEDIHEDIICPMCEGVADNPLQGACEHLFCAECIPGKRQYQCPFDGMMLKFRLPANRTVRNKISNLQLRCQYFEFGCTEIVRLGNVLSHIETCKYDPNFQISCPLGCGYVTTKSQEEDHNCVRDLRAEIESLQQRLEEEREEHRQILQEVEENRRDLQLIKRHMLFMTKPKENSSRKLLETVV